MLHLIQANVFGDIHRHKLIDAMERLGFLHREVAMVHIAPRKDLQREFRTWIIKGKVVTASQYRIGNKTVHERCTEPLVIQFAQQMADIYCPADEFVLDVCMTDVGMRIVEVNCINCAGFYEADLQKLLVAVQENFCEVVH
jgi:hypothetical protein